MPEDIPPDGDPQDGFLPHPDIENARMLLIEEKYEDAIGAVRNLVESENEEDRLEARHITAMALFNLGRYGQACDLFETVALKREDTLSWFNVMTSAILSGAEDRGDMAFQRALDAQEKSGYSQQPSVPMIRYYAARACNDAHRPGRALEHLEELKKIYLQLKITDDTFLFMRGVPFLRMTLEAAQKAFEAAGRTGDFGVWLDGLEQDVDEYGRETIRTFRTGHPGS